MPSKASQVADGFKTLQGLVQSSKTANNRAKSSKSDDAPVQGLYTSLKTANSGNDPMESGRNDMLDWRQRKSDAGFSQDRNLPAGK
jgi:hypothetical protein